MSVIYAKQVDPQIGLEAFPVDTEKPDSSFADVLQLCPSFSMNWN